MNVVIGIPHGDRATMQFVHSVLQMQWATSDAMPDVKFFYGEIECHMVSLARNKIVKVALESNADYIFWIDDDVLVPANAFLQLYRHHAPIVSGLYFTRLYPHTPQVYSRVGGGYAPVLSLNSGLHVVDAVGAGCLLVKADVYRKLDEQPRAYARDLVLSPWYEFLNERGEDFYFCDRARDAGYEILVDTTVEAQHLSTVPIGRKEYQELVNRGLIKDQELP